MKQLDFIAMKDRCEAKFKAAEAALADADSQIEWFRAQGWKESEKGAVGARKRLHANWLSLKIQLDEMNRYVPPKGGK